MLESVVNDVYERGLIPLHVCTVMKQHERGSEDKRIFVLNNIGVDFYTSGWRIRLSRSASWSNLVKMRRKHDLMIFSFQDCEFRFTSKECSKIEYKVQNILQRTRNSIENDRFKFENSSEIFSINAMGLIVRFENELPNCKKEVKSRISEIFKKRLTLVDFTEFKYYEEVFLPLLNTVKLADYVKSIKISISNPKHFEQFSHFLQTYVSTFSHIHFVGSFGGDFRNICMLMKNTDNCAINSISFTDSDLGENELNAIEELFNARPISSLSFHNSIQKNSWNNNFISRLATSEVTNSLAMLNFDGTAGVPLNSLLPSLRFLTSLSLANCKIDIAETLNMIAIHRLSYLQMICLAGNFCRESVTRVPFLRVLDVSHSTFKGNSLSSLFKSLFIMRREHFPLSLNVSYVNADDDDWERVFQKMKLQERSNLEGLSWSGNRVDSRLFDFIGRSPLITELFLNECINNENVWEISRILKKLPKLCVFSIANNNLDDIAEIMRELVNNKHLEVLNIKENNISDEIIEYLIKIVKRIPSFEEISLDGNRISDYEGLCKLIGEIRKKKQEFYFIWPKKTVKRLLSEGIINEFEAKALKLKIWRLFDVNNRSSVKFKDDFDPDKEGYEYSYDSINFPMNVCVEEINDMDYDDYPQIFSSKVLNIAKQIQFHEAEFEESLQPTVSVFPPIETLLKDDFDEVFESSSDVLSDENIKKKLQDAGSSETFIKFFGPLDYKCFNVEIKPQNRVFHKVNYFDDYEEESTGTREETTTREEKSSETEENSTEINEKQNTIEEISAEFEKDKYIDEERTFAKREKSLTEELSTEYEIDKNMSEERAFAKDELSSESEELTDNLEDWESKTEERESSYEDFSSVSKEDETVTKEEIIYKSKERRKNSPKNKSKEKLGSKEDSTIVFKDLGVRNNKHKAKPKEKHSTDSNEPSTDSKDFSTKSNENSTDSKDQKTNSNELSTDSKDLSTDSKDQNASAKKTARKARAKKQRGNHRRHSKESKSEAEKSPSKEEKEQNTSTKTDKEKEEITNEKVSNGTQRKGHRKHRGQHAHKGHNVKKEEIDEEARETYVVPTWTFPLEFPERIKSRHLVISLESKTELSKLISLLVEENH